MNNYNVIISVETYKSAGFLKKTVLKLSVITKHYNSYLSMQAD